MPVHAVAGGFRWGQKGKIYRSRAEAEAQGRAAYANGFRGDAAKRLAMQHWGASTAAESRYVLDVMAIMKATHNAVLQVVRHEVLPRQDAATPPGPPKGGPPIGLGGRLLRRIVTWQKPKIDDAFARLAKTTNAKTLATAQLYGIHVRHVVGVDAAIETARAANVSLITNATADFLSQVSDTLDDTEGLTAEEIADALKDRVGVSNSRAMLIARDQSTKLAGAIVQHRQRSAGIKRFVWSTSEDERVRRSVEWSASDGRGGDEAHAELDGEIFSWDDPPILDGEVSTPGSPINCRCVAAPDLSDLDEEPDDDDETPEPDDDEPDE
jgi:SPP1 gp7 family putative phage head morphogenesis protein